MKRGFTLIELVFVIVIIGILAAFGLPKYQGMKENAEATNVFKVVQDAISSVPPAYLNLEDLNGTEANITDIFEVRGSPYWQVYTGAQGYNGYPAWRYHNPAKGDLNATIAIDNGANPAVLHAQIVVENNPANIKYQKLRRLLTGNLGTFNGVYTIDIKLQ